VTADPADLAASRVALTFEAGALKVRPEATGGGSAEVEEAMPRPKVLDARALPDHSASSRSA